MTKSANPACTSRVLASPGVRGVPPISSVCQRVTSADRPDSGSPSACRSPPWPAPDREPPTPGTPAAAPGFPDVQIRNPSPRCYHPSASVRPGMLNVALCHAGGGEFAHLLPVEVDRGRVRLAPERALRPVEDEGTPGRRRSTKVRELTHPLARVSDECIRRRLHRPNDAGPQNVLDVPWRLRCGHDRTAATPGKRGST